MLFNLSDSAAEEALYASLSMRRFAGLDLGREPVPDKMAICRFRYLLEARDFGTKIFECIHKQLEAKGFRVSSGTIVDATSHHTPRFPNPYGWIHWREEEVLQACEMSWSPTLR